MSVIGSILELEEYLIGTLQENGHRVYNLNIIKSGRIYKIYWVLGNNLYCLNTEISNIIELVSKYYDIFDKILMKINE